MRFLFALPVLTFAIPLSAQASSDTIAVRNIIKNEIETWNKGDAVGYSRDFSAAGSVVPYACPALLFPARLVS